MDDAREEMRKLIDVIENGAKTPVLSKRWMISNSSQIRQAFLPTRWIRGLRPKTPIQRVSQNLERLWGNQNHPRPPSQNLQTHQRHKTPQLVCPLPSVRQSHRQIMTGSSHRQHKHLSEPVRNQHSLKTTSRTPLKHYSL